MVELTWHELMTEDLRAYEAAPGTPQQSNFDEHDLGDYIIERTKLNFFARDFDYNGRQLHGYKMVVPHYYPLRDLDKFFQENKSAFYERLAREITELGSIKVTMSFLEGFSMEGEGGRVEMEHFFWNRQPVIISNHEQLREGEMLERLVDTYKEEIARWQEMGSGWVEEGIKLAYLEINKYEPIRGGSYIPTPLKLRNKKAVINVKNKDDECLRWAIRAALFTAQANVDRPGSYPRDDGLDFTGIDFPTPLSQISKIEEQNNLAITVFGWCEGKTVVVRVSEVEDPNTRRIHLMMLTNKHTTHYCYIKSLSRLLASEYAAGRRIHFCERCLQGFSSERVLNDHLYYCRGVKGRPSRVEMPKKGENALFFENYQNQMKKPWVIYADFESIVEKIHGCTPDPGQSSTTETSVHKPCGFCMLAVRSDGETKGPYLYRVDGTVRVFLHCLQLLESEIREELLNKAKVKITRVDWADFRSARDCHICSKPLIKENERDAIGVYDPDTGKYAGLVHRHTNKCYQNVYNMYT